MRKLHNRKGGFTLIELMIVVAIIGILAAIAIPNFLMFQLRSKTGEAKTNLAAIRTAQEGYFAEFGAYVNAALPTPGLPAIGSTKRVWTGGDKAQFDILGWAPEGEVFFDYGVAVVGSAYTIAAVGDLDGNGVSSDYGYVHPVPGAVLGTLAPFGNCAVGGVYNPATALSDLLNTVGPCAALVGLSEF